MNVEIGNKYIGEEGFVWEVKSEGGELFVECDNLMAIEPTYPRLKYCQQI